MSMMAVLLLVAVVIVLLFFGLPRERVIEYVKELSDKLLLWFLWITSGFGSELTRDGKAEQQLWREQRLRNLKGLTHRPQQRHGEKKS